MCFFGEEGGDWWVFQWTGHSVNFGSFLAFAHYKHFYQRKFRNKNFEEERNFDRMAQQNIDPAANTSRNIKDTNLSTLSSKETHSVSKRYTDLLIKNSTTFQSFNIVGSSLTWHSRKRRDVTSGQRCIATMFVGVNKPIIYIVVNRETLKNAL